MAPTLSSPVSDQILRVSTGSHESIVSLEEKDQEMARKKVEYELATMGFAR